jgi:hypothetical protein
MGSTGRIDEARHAGYSRAKRAGHDRAEHRIVNHRRRMFTTERETPRCAIALIALSTRPEPTIAATEPAIPPARQIMTVSVQLKYRAAPSANGFHDTNLGGTLIPAHQDRVDHTDQRDDDVDCRRCSCRSMLSLIQCKLD